MANVTKNILKRYDEIQTSGSSFNIKLPYEDAVDPMIEGKTVFNIGETGVEITNLNKTIKLSIDSSTLKLSKQDLEWWDTTTSPNVPQDARITIDNGTPSKPSYSFNDDNLSGLYLESLSHIGMSVAGQRRLLFSTTNVTPSTAGSYNIGSTILPIGNVHTNFAMHGNGAVATPSIAFNDEPTTGFYKSNIGELSLSLLGSNVVTINNNINSSLPIKVVGGSNSNPSYGFTDILGTGLYATSNDLNISVNTIPVISFLQSSIKSNQQIQTISGSAANPSYSWTSSTNTGLFYNGYVGIAVDGVEVAKFDTNGLSLPSGNVGFSDGSAALPSITFTNDTNTGLFRSADNEIGFTTNGSTMMVVGTTDVTIMGNLNVQGSSTIVNSTNLNVTDNIIILNKDESGNGVTLVNSGIEINRGSATNVGWYYNESNDWWFPGGASGSLTGSTTLGNISTLNSRTTSNQTLTIDASALLFNTNNGFYNNTSDISIKISTATIEKISAASVEFYVPVSVEKGSVTNPTYTFNGDTNTGIYSPSDNVVAISSNGQDKVVINTTSTVVNNELSVQSEVVGNPVGGNKGSGTINAEQIYKNNIPVATVDEVIAYAIVFGG